MATINASTGADIIVPSNNGTTYRGLEGNDTYILSNAIAANAKVTIVDTNGSDTIQLVDGLSITSSKFAADSVQLTLSNGAVVTVNNADQFTFEVGGNETSGVTGSSSTYAQLASAMGVSSLPTGSTITDGTSGTVSGSSVTSSASSYALSADTNSVAEGGSITYTITANAAVSSDTTFTYNVAGDTNGATVDKATAGDTDSLSGNVVMASGSSTATFTIAATSDSTAEGLEGIKVSVFDSSNAVIGSISALISNNSSLENTVTNLTTATDDVVGGSGKDTIGAAIGTNSLASNGTTAQAGDTVDGGLGIDTLKVSISGTNTTAQTLSNLTLANVETIAVSNFDTSTDDNTIDMSLMTGVQEIGLVASSATGDTVFSNVPNLMTINAMAGSGDITVTYGATVIAGLTDANTINVSGYTGTISNLSVESITLNSGAARSVIAALTSTNATSLTITGDTSLTITTALGAVLKTVDASATTAGVSLTMATTATSLITGGSGDDTINYDSTLNAAGADVFDGGAGTDTIIVDLSTTLTPTAVAGITNVEVLEVNTLQTTYTDADVIPTITTVRASGVSDGITGAKIKFTDLPNNINIQVRGTEGVEGQLAVNSSADVANVSYATATGAGVIATTLNLPEFETINITTGSSATATGPVTNSVNSVINISGVGALNLGNSSSTVLKVVDASGLVGLGGLTMGTNAAAAVYGGVTITGSGNVDTLVGGLGTDTITGGAGNDIISAGAGVDTVDGGAGNDIIKGEDGADILTGGAGNDVFLVDDSSDFTSQVSAEVMIGGAGNDTLSFTENAGLTVASTDLHGASGIETISVRTESASAITLDDTFFTNNGSTSIKVDNKAVAGTKSTAGALTLNAASVSAANSITVALNVAANVDDIITGGAGDDTFTYSSATAAATGLEAADVITGGKGNDTLAITATGFNVDTFTTTGITNVETITVSGSAGLNVGLTLTDAVFNTAALASSSGNGTTAAIVGVVDGSAMTGSGVLTVDGGVEDDSKMIITGGNGNDILTGGAKADTISGGSGSDTLNGAGGIDIITGGAGNDVLNLTDVSDFIGLTAVEVFDGGSGTDTVNFTEDATTTVAASDLLGLVNVEKFTFEGNGVNSLTLSDSVYSSNGVAKFTLQDTNAAGAVTIDAAGLSAANSISYKSTTIAADTVDTITGGAGDDAMSFYEDTISATDVLDGGSGSDKLSIAAIGGDLIALTTTSMTKFETLNLTDDGIARALPVTLTAGFFQGATGAVTAGTTKGVVTLDGSAETLTAMTITTGVGNDIITGGSKGDTIKTGTGDDVITGGPGADILTGGAGSDDFKYTDANALGSVVESNSASADSITDFLSGTDELKFTADFSSNNSAVNINAVTLTAVTSKTAAQDSLSGERLQSIYNTTDSVLYINYNADNLITTQDYQIGINAGASPATTLVVDNGTSAGDIDWTITGTAFADIISTGGGDDIIGTGVGGDVVNGGAGVDTITGGTGNDTLSGGAGNDIIVGANGVDIINGNAGDDAITGGSGVDTVNGGAGNDIIISLAGVDIINGGDGNDTITDAAGASVLNGGAGNDIISGAADADIINGGTGTNIILDGAADDIIELANGGIDNATVTTGDNQVGMTTLDDINAAKFVITDVSGTTHDAALGGTITADSSTVDRIVGFDNDNIAVSGALQTALSAGKGAHVTVLNGSGGNEDLDTGAVIIVNTAQKGAAAYTAATNGFGDASGMITQLNTGIGTATAGDAGDQYILVIADSTANIHGMYYWKDVDGNDAINAGDELALIGIVMTNNAMVAADITS